MFIQTYKNISLHPSRFFLYGETNNAQSLSILTQSEWKCCDFKNNHEISNKKKKTIPVRLARTCSIISPLTAMFLKQSV